jgi:hypothetical protein
MSYIINNSRGNVIAVVANGTVNTTATNLALVGRAVTDYGTYENENYVYLLENFANSTAPTHPILGQLWYNSTTDTLSAYNSANTWTALASQDYVQAQKISPAFTGTPTAPTAAIGTATFQIATTSFVINQLGSANSIVSVGNITGGNLLTSGLISASGSVTSGGNITGGNITGGNILTAGMISAGGNISGGNLNVAGLSLSANVVSVLNVSGNIAGANILTPGILSAGGSVYGANFVGNITMPAGSPVSTTGNVVGGNFLTSGVVSASGNITTTNTLIANVVIANTVITNGTTSAFRLPNLTQTQINTLTPSTGDMVYNTTTGLPQVYQSSGWVNFTVSYYS